MLVTLDKSNYKTLLFLFLVVLGMAVLTWFVLNRKQDTVEVPAVKALEAPQDQSPFTDLEGNAVGLTSYVGEVIVVSSWASWCPSCVDSLKELSLLSGLYGDEVKILAVNRSDQANIAKAFLKKYEISNTVELVLDEDDRFFKKIDGYTMPETVIYDHKGREVFHKHGVTSVVELKLIIDEILVEGE
ncbi:TlpA family protein disulfide reductase [Candidatus Nomurabacteria bacterium]|nr:TlpA family protein disulfide reductase [Candidatus Nomurabacteria bacterium]